PTGRSRENPAARLTLKSRQIGVWIDNRRALEIRPGYLLWPGGRVPDLPPDLFPDMQRDSDVAWHALSTFRPRAGDSGRNGLDPAICTSCSMTLPGTGLCDNCG
ncbi:MAG: hypothetical protein ACOH2F_03820, partial [Cellulomonas sp.]